MPPINLLAVVLSPVGKVLSMFAKLFLRMIGIKTEDGGRVSEEQLRLLVAGAQKSGGIEAQEGQMINQVRRRFISTALGLRLGLNRTGRGLSASPERNRLR